MAAANIGSECVVTTSDAALPMPPQAGKSPQPQPPRWLELITEIAAAPRTTDAAIEIATRVPALVGGGRVAVGVARPGKACRLVAVTGLATLDRHGTLTRAYEAALDEVLWLHERGAEQDDVPRMARQHLAKVTQTEQVVSVLLREPRIQPATVILLWLGEPGEPAAQHVRALLGEVERPLAATLGTVIRADRSIFARVHDSVQRLVGHRTGRWIAGVLLLAIGALAIPVPYRVTCDATIEPVTRRYVAAPFEATLQRTLIRPGDVVQQGQELAQLDGREIRWELAALDAEIHSAQKKRDAALAARDAAAAEIARLEIEQRQQRRAVLQARSDQLVIRSPIDGVVTVGDLQRAQGVRVTVGQTLFEVAPLETMIVEIGIPEEELGHLDEGAEVETRVDAYADQVWTGHIDVIRPRSEIRDASNVFIAEVRLDNTKGELRPGMQCRSRIAGPHAPLGWCLFHRGFEAAARWLGW